jgi:hypothetical protein
MSFTKLNFGEHTQLLAYATSGLAAVALLTSCHTRTSHDADHSNPMAEFAPNGIPMDWGRLNPPSGVPVGNEALLANAAALALNTAAAITDRTTGWPQGSKATDAVAAVPLQFFSNDSAGENHPFGDGQKNASLGWPGWQLGAKPRPPLLATLVTVQMGVSGSASPANAHLIVIEADARILGSDGTPSGLPAAIGGEIADDSGQILKLSLALDVKQGVYRGIVTLAEGFAQIQLGATAQYPADFTAGPEWLNAANDRFAWPRLKLKLTASESKLPTGTWPLLFRFPSDQSDTAVGRLPDAEQRFANRGINETPYTEPGSTKPPIELMRSWYDAQPADNQLTEFHGALGGPGVHHEFFDGKKKVRTASGGVDTWVVKEPIGNIQLLFTCFAARDPGSEAQWGVPSGAGWHSIGHELPGQHRSQWTFGETIVNGFEASGIFAGWGVRAPNPDVSESPFGAKDIATFRVLRKGESFTTARTHFHWYAVDAARPVCTSIWKHVNCPEGQNSFDDKSLQCKSN